MIPGGTSHETFFEYEIGEHRCGKQHGRLGRSDGDWRVRGWCVCDRHIGRRPLGYRELLVKRGKLKSLEIGELTVTRLRVSELTVSDALTLPPKP